MGCADEHDTDQRSRRQRAISVETESSRDLAEASTYPLSATRKHLIVLDWHGLPRATVQSWHSMQLHQSLYKGAYIPKSQSVRRET